MIETIDDHRQTVSAQEPDPAEAGKTTPDMSKRSADYLLLQQHMDIAYFLDQLPGHDRPTDPIQHYLENGMHLDPTVDFSTRFYLDRSPDVAQAGAHPFLHYLK
ncbi:MAG: hypothetical protein ACK4NW_04935, partial [Roseinatronobacter sp.]